MQDGSTVGGGWKERAPEPGAGDQDGAGEEGATGAAPGEIAGRSRDRMAAEAAALASAEGSLADAAGVGGTLDQTFGDAVGASAGIDGNPGAKDERGDPGT